MTAHRHANAHRSASTPGPDPTPYAHSLTVLRRSSVPAGWRPVFDDAVRRLQGMDCPQRSDLRVTGPWIDNGQLAFSLSRVDRCVDGLVRRTAAQLQARCELCGRSGRMRLLGIRSRVLCAECFAPRALEQDINRLLDEGRAQEPIVFEADVPPRIRAVVRPDSWREHRDAHGHLVRYLLREDLRGWPNLLLSAVEVPAASRAGAKAG